MGDEKLPKIGEYSVVTDYDLNPKCIIKTTGLTKMKFKDMTFDIASREGEDKCLDSWIIGHRKFFIEEGEQLGYKFTDELLILFEDFEVVYISGNK